MPLTYEEVQVETIYVRRGAEHQRRIVTGKYLVQTAALLLDKFPLDPPETAMVFTPEVYGEGEQSASMVFFRTLDPRGRPVELHAACCTLAEFNEWLEGDR